MFLRLECRIQQNHELDIQGHTDFAQSTKNSTHENTGVDPVILKRGFPTRVKGAFNYMLPFKCIDRPKKRRGSNPRNPPPGFATENKCIHSTRIGFLSVKFNSSFYTIRPIS